MAVGIDFGTTNSYVSKVVDGAATVLCDKSGIPSVFSYDGNIEYVGEDAINNVVNDIVYSVKSDLYAGINKNYDLCGRKFSSTEIAEKIIKYVYNDSISKAKLKKESAVIGVPVKSNENCRNAIKEAAEKAGINVLALVEEPVAAGIFLMKNIGKKYADKLKDVAVFDFGGGTFDISVISKNNDGDDMPFLLKAHDGTNIGGDDCDDRLRKLVEKKLSDAGKKLSGDIRHKNKFKRDITTAKEALSTQDVVCIDVDIENKLRYTVEVTKQEFEASIDDLINQITRITIDLIKNYKDINCLMFAGGSSSIPLCRKKIESEFNSETITYEPVLYSPPAPKYSVSNGLAYYAAEYKKTNSASAIYSNIINSLSAHTYGVKVKGINPDGSTYLYVSNIIFKNETLPVSRSETFCFFETKDSVTVQVMESDEDQWKADIPVNCAHKVADVTLQFPEKMPKGYKVDVEYTINLSGILEVCVKDMKTLNIIRRTI